MKRVLVITSGFQLIPAVNGGAVEVLTTNLLDCNEIQNKYCFDVYSIGCRNYNFKYDYSRFHYIYNNKVEVFFEKVLNKFYRLTGINKLFSVYNIKLKKNLRENKSSYDYVLFENSMDLFSDIVKIFPNSKYIFHLHNDLNDSTKSPRMAIEVADKANKIVFVSDFLKEKFISITRCDRDKCSVLYNCTDTSYEISKLEANSNQYGLIKDKIKYLYVGRLNGEKGILELAKAFAKLNFEDCQLIICGGTWGREFTKNNYVKQIEESIKNVRNNVIFTGYLEPENVRELYSLCDAVVIPSICNEAFGMVMLEAAICKKPIIATKSGGMVEIIPDYNELMIDINNNVIDELCEKMKEFHDNPHLWDRMVVNAYCYVTSDNRYSKDDYLNKLMNIMENCDD